MMRGRVAPLLAALALSAAASALCAAPAGAAFGLKDVDVTFSAEDGTALSQAGSHPFETTATLAVNTVFSEAHGYEIPEEDTKDLRVTFFPGFIAAPAAIPSCSNADFLSPGSSKCPLSTVIGVNDVTRNRPDETDENIRVYNIAPPPGVALKIGFIVLGVPVTVEGTISESPPYNAVAKVTKIPQVVPFYRSELTLWGTPADPAHDAERGGSSDSPEAAFITVPRSCEGPQETIFEANSWQSPGFFDKQVAVTHDDAIPPNPLGFTGCGKLGFSPTLLAQPTTKAAQSPTGLDTSLEVTDEGLTNPTGLAHSEIREAAITFPEGMTLNPSAASGLEACSEAELAEEKAKPIAGKGCPAASKVGTVQIESPLVEESVNGALYVAEPFENPAGSLLAAYLVARNPTLGVIVKQTLELQPDPETGQLTVIAKEIPQLPFSHLSVHLSEGARSPLISPPQCGSHEVEAEFVPWAGGPPLITGSSFEIITGPGEGPCPPGSPPFRPGFSAGTLNNSAGSFSPFYMRLTRKDGDQDMTRFAATLPPGMVAKLAGTTMCSDQAIAVAKAKTGKQEQAQPSCPASADVGRVLGGAGVGSQLLYVPGEIYLAGPYNGAPLSVVAIVPAVAGPFDVGNVVTRQALSLNPRTGVVLVDGSRSDPIPHILAGIPLNVRDIRVYADKPKFTINPTSCDPFSVGAQMWGGGIDPFSDADDVPILLSDRFQAANCAALGFKPSLTQRLQGGTKRGGHPALRATFTPRPDDANLKGLVVRLPRSAFLDQGHIRTICTRVQFAADTCPQGAVYGQARVFTPLLDTPLEGPVYLRSSDHNLPDMVFDLHGLVDVEVIARIDSVNGGIRASFEDIPDAPVSKAELEMQGGRKGLIVNSTDLCARKRRANVGLSGQNGKRHDIKPVVRASCGKASKSARLKRR